MEVIPGRTEVEKNLKAIIKNLYNLTVQSLDHQPDVGKDVMTKEVRTLLTSLQSLMTSSQNLSIDIPPDIVKYVEESRNPDIYQRQFIESVQRMNQQLSGRADAYATFRDLLAKEIVSAVPTMKGNVRRSVEFTGGRLEEAGERAG